MNEELLKALAMAGGYAAVALAAVGSAIGSGVAGQAAIAAWKRCYAQNKPAPFLLVALAGTPLSQTIYGMILMILIKGGDGNGIFYLAMGIFAGIGLTEHVYNKSNGDGMHHTDTFAEKDFTGLCFVNLVDFDMQFGHRRDIDGYAKALTEFDAWLGQFLPTLGEEDVVMITADHGCDPAYTATTDHTREYVPLLILGKQVKNVNLGTRESFADIAATVAEMLNVDYETPGKSFAKEVLV